MAVKNKLKYYRSKLEELENRKITQYEFAQFLGVSVNHYNRWENQRTQPHIETAFKICKKLNIKLDDLFFEED